MKTWHHGLVTSALALAEREGVWGTGYGCWDQKKMSNCEEVRYKKTEYHSPGCRANTCVTMYAYIGHTDVISLTKCC